MCFCNCACACACVCAHLCLCVSVCLCICLCICVSVSVCDSMQDKGQLERILTELDHNNRDLKSEVVDRVARENTLESGIEGLHEQKQLNIRMLSELQAKVSLQFFQ